MQIETGSVDYLPPILISESTFCIIFVLGEDSTISQTHFYLYFCQHIMYPGVSLEKMALS